MTTIVFETVPCPYCGHSVDIGKATDVKIRAWYMDFREETASETSILDLSAHYCDHCGYCATDFQEELPDDHFSLLKEHVKCFQEVPETWVIYATAAKLATIRKLPNIEIGRIYLKAAWSGSESKNSDIEKLYRYYAVQYYEKAIQDHEVDVKHIPIVTYMVGELYRRINLLELSNEWFDKVILNKDKKGWKEASQMAFNQRHHPLDRYPNPNVDSGVG